MSKKNINSGNVPSVFISGLIIGLAVPFMISDAAYVFFGYEIFIGTFGVIAAISIHLLTNIIVVRLHLKQWLFLVPIMFSAISLVLIIMVALIQENIFQ